eukprot:3088648-Pleurochrysis_carterae.AAC.1
MAEVQATQRARRLRYARYRVSHRNAIGVQCPRNELKDDVIHPLVARGESAQGRGGEVRCAQQRAHRSTSDVDPHDVEGDA